MKLSIVVVAVTFVAAVQGVTYKFEDCIRVDVNGSLTIAAEENGISIDNKTIDLVAVDPTTISGTCSNDSGSSASMTVKFGGSIEWLLVFNVDSNNIVMLDQLLRFNASEVFNNTALPTDFVSMTDRGNITLSPKNDSYICAAVQNFSFELNSNTTDNVTYTVTQTIRDLKAQAFGLDNGNYSGSAVDCESDKKNSTTEPTTAPTTEPTTAPAAPTTPAVPTVKPVDPVMFVVNDSQGVACFRLDAGLQFAVDYNTTNNTMVFSKVRIVDGSANVTGTCGNETATMVIAGSDYQLEITETLTTDTAGSKISLNVTLDAENFPDAADANTSMVYESTTQSFNQSNLNTYYMCNSEQMVTLGSTRTTLYADQVRLQAFGLNKGQFTGDGEGCDIDPTPSPSTPAPTPSDNVYAVTDGKNITCIVLKGDISFSNITYLQGNATVPANPINIPAYNTSNPDVKVNGTCGNITQEINIVFNGNWSLSMVFIRGGSKESAMLGAAQDEYSVRDIAFTYDLRPEFFPNASNPGAVQKAEQMNMTDGLWKGQVGGGSYKCDADITTSLSEGVLLDTSHLQYKAFNTNNDTTFNSDNVSECPADDESNSIVPIAVGAALAGLVVIVLIAYLIGRRRSRRQGYESV